MLIALTGRTGCGKDTVGNGLWFAGWQAIAFADALRAEVVALWHTDARLFTERVTKEQPTPSLAAGICSDAAWLIYADHHQFDLRQPRSPRWLMQQWGSFRRTQDRDHWVQQVQRWISTRLQHHNGANLVVTDVRLPNEAAAIRQLGGYIVRLHRPGLAALPADTASHESEQYAGIAIDAEIHNTADLRHLAAETWRVIEQLRVLNAAITPARRA